MEGPQKIEKFGLTSKVLKLDPELRAEVLRLFQRLGRAPNSLWILCGKNLKIHKSGDATCNWTFWPSVALTSYTLRHPPPPRGRKVPFLGA